MAICLTQPPALPGAHGAVVEVEVQIADPRFLLIGDVAIAALKLGDVEPLAGVRKGERRWELDVGLLRARLPKVGHPDGAIDRGPADRPMALRDDLARRAAKLLLAVDAEEMEVGTGDLVEDTRMTLGRPDLADDGVRRVRRPVDRANVLLHERPSLADYLRVTPIERARRLAVEGPLDRLDERVDRRAAHLVPVDAALSGRAHRNVRVAQTSPALKSPFAWRTVTPHSRSPSSIAQSSEEGPRSPTGPGWTIRQRCVAQIDSGIRRVSIGQTIRSGPCSATAASMASAPSTTATSTR